MRIDLTTRLTDPKGEPFTRCQHGGDVVFAMFKAEAARGRTFAEAIEAVEKSIGPSMISPMDVGDMFYLAVTTCPKASAGDPSERRELGRLADLLVKEGVVEITDKDKAAIVAACDAVFNGIVLVRIDRLFAQALLDESKPRAVEATG